MELMQKNRIKESFEENSFVSHTVIYWWSSWLMEIMGYKSKESFTKVMSKARQFCDSVGIDIQTNFRKTKIYVKDHLIDEYCISLFGCYIMVMQADDRKEEIKMLRKFFKNNYRSSSVLMNQLPSLERRFRAREQLREDFLVLNKMASKSGVVDFKSFVNAGYEGLYLLEAGELKLKKNIAANQSYFDNVGEVELLTHLFRIQMTIESMKFNRVGSPSEAIMIHQSVAESIRSIFKKNTGKNIEDFPKEQSLVLIARKLEKLSEKMNANQLYIY